MAVNIAGRNLTEKSTQEVLDQAWRLFDLYDECLALLEVDELPTALHQALYGVLAVRKKLGIAEKHELRILKGME